MFWVPRDQNEEADALTNEEFSAFDPATRVSVQIGQVKWLILHDMLAISEEIYTGIQARKSAAQEGRAAAMAKLVVRTRPGDRLRVRERW